MWVCAGFVRWLSLARGLSTHLMHRVMKRDEVHLQFKNTLWIWPALSHGSVEEIPAAASPPSSSEAV